MNLILLFEEDFVGEHRVRLEGRRRDHVLSVHRAAVGDALTVGVVGGRIGRGVVLRLDPLDLEVTLDRDPPPALPLTLVLALPRPKVLNRVIAGATSMGIKRICLINAWRVEKSYWRSPKLSDLTSQSILGLEQAVDTVLPAITLHRLFRPFVEDELRELAAGTRALVAHPGSHTAYPRNVREPITLAIGPEGGFIEAEIASLIRAGFAPVSLGPRILRVETAVAYAVGTITRRRVAGGARRRRDSE